MKTPATSWACGLRRFIPRALILVAMALGGAAAQAADPEVTIIIKDHRFIPEEVEIPAGVKVKLIVRNEDATPEEFESYELNREKIIGGKGQGIVFVGPLKPGTYPFFGEFNPKTAQGRILVK